MNADSLDFIAGTRVIEREMSDEEVLFFILGAPRLEVPHSRGEKVVKLTAPPPPEWSIEK